VSEVRDRYPDPGAFRTALTQRLRRLAESSPWTLAELQRQIAYDRFLQRLNASDDGWVLKGAAALLAREVSTRATRDVDLYRRTELAEAETALREAIALDLGDWFTFEASRSRQMTAGVIGVTFALTARIGIREWESFNVDLVGEAAGMTGEPDTAPALARIDLVELDQPGYRVWPLADHVADKVTATFATYGRTNRASTRVKDLIDLVVIAHCAQLSAQDAIVAVRAQASRRDLVLPERFGIPDMDHWSRHTRSKRARFAVSQSRRWPTPSPWSAISLTPSWREPLPARGTRSPCVGATGSEGHIAGDDIGEKNIVPEASPTKHRSWDPVGFSRQSRESPIVRSRRLPANLGPVGARWNARTSAYPRSGEVGRGHARTC